MGLCSDERGDNALARQGRNSKPYTLATKNDRRRNAQFGIFGTGNDTTAHPENGITGSCRPLEIWLIEGILRRESKVSGQQMSHLDSTSSVWQCLVYVFRQDRTVSFSYISDFASLHGKFSHFMNRNHNLASHSYDG